MGTIKTLDVPRSNEFIYTENVNALYANYNRQLKGKVIQLGVRMENTVSDGSTYALNNDASVNTASRSAFKRNYVDFFPSASTDPGTHRCLPEKNRQPHPLFRILCDRS